MVEITNLPVGNYVVSAKAHVATNPGLIACFLDYNDMDVGLDQVPDAAGTFGLQAAIAFTGGPNKFSLKCYSGTDGSQLNFAAMTVVQVTTLQAVY